MTKGDDEIDQLTRALQALQQLRARLNGLEAARAEPIAIVGLACRFPGGADSAESFWRLLTEGRDAITDVPVDRWDAAALYDPDADAVGSIASRWGGFLDDVEHFDAPFFGISRREAAAMDPQQRLLLEVSWEALEHAGQPKQRLARSATGVFIGIHSHSSDYSLLQLRDVADVGTYTSTGTAHSIVANRLSYWLDLRGPSLAVDTACSSSLVAVHLAVQSLRLRECDMALAGGVNLLLTPEVTAALSRMRMLAADGRCKTFDAAADGFVRGEGCGVVVLKRLSDALAGRDPVLAVIAGSAVNQDGATNGLTAPSGLAQQEVVRRALTDGRVDPATVGYVETHGTGTPLGDPIEVEALAAVLGTAGSAPCLLGAVKSNIGHLEGAAGIAGLIKTVLTLQHGVIPPNVHFRGLNPHIDLAGTRLEVPTAVRPWPAGASHAGVSSFGFGGTNAHVVLGRAPEKASRPAGTSGRPHVLAVSAQTPAALRQLAGRYAQVLADSSISLADVCHTAAGRRTHHAYRLAATGRTAGELEAALSAFARGEARPDLAVGHADVEQRRRLVWVFSGQGSQWPGMGAALLQEEPVFRAALEECDRLLRPLAGWSLLAEITAPAAVSRLDRTEIAQPAICALQIALAALWRSWGITPDAVVGHSVGEVAAAHVAGVLSLDAAMRVIHERGRIMQRAPVGAMAAVGLSREETEKLIGRSAATLALAAVNGPASCVISGSPAAIEAALAELDGRGVFARRLPVALAAHSADMEPLRPLLVQALDGLTVQPAAVPIYSSVSGRGAERGDFDAAYWGRNLREPVLFADALSAARGSGVADLVELSPHPILRASMDQAAGAADGLVLGSLERDVPDSEALFRSLAALHTRGVHVAWDALDAAGAHVVPLPSYPWQRARYWLDTASSRRGGRVDDPRADADGPLAPGRRLSSPGIQGAIFESRLSAESMADLGEHRIGAAAVVPAAWFIELLAAASRDVLRSDGVTVEEMHILHPLVLEPGTERVVHSILQPPSADGTAWELHSRSAAEPDGWLLHATARISIAMPRVAVVAGREAAVADACWRAAGEALIQLPDRSGAASDAPALRHAALLDACLRFAADAADAVPQAGEHFVVGGLGGLRLHTALPEPLVCHAWRHVGSVSGDALLMRLRLCDVAGSCVAELDEVRFAALTIPGADDAEHHDSWHFDVAWRPRSMLRRTSTRAAPWHMSACDVAGHLEASRTADVGQPALSGRDLNADLDRASAAYVVQALRGMGVSFTAGESFAEDDLALTLALSANHGRLLRRILEMLREDGILEPRDGSWHVVGEPEQQDADALIEALLQRFPEHGSELRTFRRCAAALHDVLGGRCDPLQLLFQEEARHDTERLYRDAPLARAANALVRDAVAYAVGQVPEQRVLKVLEIGGGTGGTTSHVLPLLPDGRAEYVFTDISPAFLKQAEERFRGQPSVRLELLDVERDPHDQGFAAGTFDIIIAANVLHATSHVDDAVSRIRRLLAPGGLLLLVEGVRPARWIDLTFGQTAGWWRFDDARRSAHPLLPADAWLSVLHAAGFADAHALYVDAAEVATWEQAVIVASTAVAADVPAAQPRPRDVRVAGRIFVFAADPALGDSIAEGVAARGGDCLLVTAGRGQDAQARLREWLAVDAVAPRSVIFLCSSSHAHTDPLRIHEQVQWTCAELAAAARAMMDAEGPTSPRLWIVTRGAQSVMRGEDVDPAQAALWGFGRSLALEAPQNWGGLIDLAAGSDLRRDADDVIAQVITTDREDQVAFRHGSRLVPRLQAAAPAAGAESVSFDGAGAYLITGGIGDLGLALARWLTTRGARSIVLTARTSLPERSAWSTLPPDSPAAQRVQALREIEASGVRVEAVSVDVSDVEGMTRLVSRFGQDLPALRGVFHTAGVMEFSPLPRLESQQIEAVLRPKVMGGWLLHQLTRHLQLDHFVLFASVAGLWGSRGMTHYAAANQFLDALAHHRRSEGLPALTVDWGGWAGGDASRATNRFLAQSDFRLMPRDHALAALGAAMAAGIPQRAIAWVDWASLRTSYELGAGRPFLEEITADEHAAESSTTARPAAGLLQQLQAAADEDARALLTSFVRGEVASVLGMDTAHLLEPAQGFFRLGMDSLMTVELRRRLEHGVGLRLPPTIAFEYPTVEALTGYLAGRVLSHAGAEATPETGLLRAESAAAPASDLQTLSEAELAVMLDGALADLLDDEGNAS